MSKAVVTLHRCIQDSQEYGSDDQYMVSRVFFSMKIDSNDYMDLYTDIKQAVGGNFETDPLEVTRPTGYRGPFNYDVFRDEVERYYRGLVGSQGSGIHIEGGSNVRMYNNVFVKEITFEFDISGSGTGW